MSLNSKGGGLPCPLRNIFLVIIFYFIRKRLFLLIDRETIIFITPSLKDILDELFIKCTFLSLSPVFMPVILVYKFVKHTVKHRTPVFNQLMLIQ